MEEGIRQRAQTATEYLLILGGATALIAIIGMVIYSTLFSGQGATNCNFDFMKQNLVLPSDGVNITNPTVCRKVTFTGTPSFSVDFNYGGSVEFFDITLKNKNNGNIYSCKLKQPVTPSQSWEKITCSTWSVVLPTTAPISAGVYDLNVTVFKGDYLTTHNQKSAIEAGAITVK